MLRIDINLLFTVVNLLILFAALKIFLFKPVQRIIEARQTEADKQFLDAEKCKYEADTIREQYEKAVAEDKEKRQLLMINTKKEAEEECKKIVSKAVEEAQEIRQYAAKEAQDEREKIIRDVESEITEFILDAASKVSASMCSEESNRALLDQFIGKAGDGA